MKLVGSVYICPSVRQVLIRNADVRSMYHQVMRSLIRKVDIAAVDIYDHTSLYFCKIVHDCTDVSGSCIHIMIIIVGTIVCHVKFRIRSVCSKSTVMGYIRVYSAEVSVTEVVSDICVTAMTEVMTCMSEIVSYIVTGIEVVAVTEIVSVTAAHIVTVHVARVGRRISRRINWKIRSTVNTMAMHAKICSGRFSASNQFIRNFILISPFRYGEVPLSNFC